MTDAPVQPQPVKLLGGSILRDKNIPIFNDVFVALNQSNNLNARAASNDPPDIPET